MHTESAFEGLKALNIQPRIVPAVLTRQVTIPDVPICGQSGPRFPFPAESGNGGFPDSRSRPSRESEIPSPFPGQIGNRGDGNCQWGFPGVKAQISSRSGKSTFPPAPGRLIKNATIT